MNYYSSSRTNYFHVTDEEKFKQLMSCLSCGEGDVEDFTEKDKDGRLLHGFGCTGSIEYYPPDENGEPNFDEDTDFDAFLAEMQKILPPDEAFVYMESGAEGLRYVTGMSIVVTSTEIKCMDIRTMTIQYVAQYFKERGIEPHPLKLDY